MTRFIKSKFIEFLRNKESEYFLIVFIFCLIIHFCFSIIGWSHNLLDQHGFRQTQTALTTFYTIKDGFKFAYITPVFGYPWSIPFELPLYQWIVSSLVILFHTSIDQTGRFVSLIFFYLSLIPIFLILKLFVNKNKYIFLILCLILINPIYMFWSRTFMIESLALFLGLSYCWLSISAISTNKRIILFFALIIGCFAALVKITTFIVLCTPILFLLVYFIIIKKIKNNFDFHSIIKSIIFFIILILIPLIVSIFWTHFADEIKSQNPLTTFITSTSLNNWNFGSISQKFNYSTWSSIFENSSGTITIFGEIKFAGFRLPILFIILGLFTFNKYYRKHAYLSLVFFLIGPIIFTNLYFIHTYYFYANSFFISLSIGFILAGLMEQFKQYNLLISYIIFPLILLFLFLAYKDRYLGIQIQNNESLTDSISAIKKFTSPDDVVIIYGQDWDSSISYYSERKAIMLRNSQDLNDKSVLQVISKTKNVNAIAFYNMNDNLFIMNQVQHLNLNMTPVFWDKKTETRLFIH